MLHNKIESQGAPGSFIVTSVSLEFFLLIYRFFRFVPLIEPANIYLYLEIRILTEFIVLQVEYLNLVTNVCDSLIEF